MSISDDDAKIRQNWQEGHKVSIFSNSRKKWFDGSVAQIFHDEEGEWLEIRYDKSMSKQVQRYSTDIKPTDKQKKDFQLKKQQEKKKNKKPSSTPDAVPFPENEMNLRKSWSKNDDVEIFSNTHQEWYRGEIVEIIKDDEGEWLNVVWARNNGEAMSKQVQRFSTDVRPAQDDSDSSDPGGTDTLTDKYLREIQGRINGFVREAPLFSRTIHTSTFSRPATGALRQKKRLQNVDEKDEKSAPKKGPNVNDWDETKVQQFVQGLGRAYMTYKSKFRGIKGIDLIQLNEKALINMGLKKLHRLKLFFELARVADAEHHHIFDDADSINVMNWDAKRVRKWAAKQPTLSQYANNFQRHGVDGVLLFELDDDDLDTIGIRANHRSKVFDTIEELHRFSFPNAPTLHRERKSNAQDEKDEEITLTTTAKPSSSKRRQSVMQVEPLINTGSAKDDLLIEIANLVLSLGNGMNGVPGVKAGVESVQKKLDEYLSEQKSGNNTSNGNSSSRLSVVTNSNDLMSGYDITVDTNMEEESTDEVEGGTDMMESMNGDNGKRSKMNHRTMERLDDASSPAGMGYAANYINTLEQKKGHRRRQSLPYINSEDTVAALEEHEESDDEDTEDAISDIE